MTRNLTPIKKIEKTELNEDPFTARVNEAKSMTNLQLVISIVRATQGRSYAECLYRADPELAELGVRLNTNRYECFLIAAAMELDDEMTLLGLQHFLKCTHLESMLFEEHLDGLVKRRYMKKVGYDSRYFRYVVQPGVVHAVHDNKPYKQEKVKTLDDSEFWEAVGEIYDRHEFHFFSANYELDTLLKEQKNQPLAKIRKQEGLSDKTMLFLAWACWFRVCYGKPDLEVQMLWHMNGDDCMSKVFQDTVKGTSELAQKRLMEMATEDGIVMTDTITLTEGTARMLIGEELLKCKECPLISGFIKSDSIPAKELFYNEEEDSVVKEIMRTIDDENFKQIQQRMKEASFRTSFPILLYGEPGVGKTELCFQLARLSGRDLIEVKLSDLRDKYVGEGQKNVQQIFDHYRNIVKNHERCPILLLNEADGILTKRAQNTESYASKEENAMQNIFLREFEKFEGILIATTNLQSNFDPAFERRFLLKLKLSAPCEKARIQIWKSQVKGLSEADATRLGKEFALSGGQIENCARRQMIKHLLDGTEANYSVLEKLAREELGYKKTNFDTIGFKVA